MLKRDALIFLIVSFTCVSIFFYKIILGLAPFPGDVLVSSYGPFKYYSYLGYSPGAIPNKAQYFDTVRQIYPWRMLANNVLKRGEFPLWNPYNFSGTPLLANVQSAIFYPLNIIYFIFPMIASWSILVFMQVFLTIIFTYFYARSIGISMIGGLLSSIGFGFCLFMTVFLEYNTIGHVIIWLPLILLAFEKILYLYNLNIFDNNNLQLANSKIDPKNKKQNLRNSFKNTNTVIWSIVFIFATLSSFFAGHIQVFGFVMIFSIIYFLCRIIYLSCSSKLKIFYLAYIFILLLLSFGIGSIQFFPTIELILQSARVSQDYNFMISKLLLQSNQLILFLSPDFFGNPATQNLLIDDTYPGNAVYVGLATIIFALISLSHYKKNFQISFFAYFIFLLVILIVRNPINEIFYKINIPFFSTGSISNAIFLISFSIAILSGYGIDAWISKKIRIITVVIVFISSTFLIVWFSVFFFNPEIVSIKNFIFSTVILILLISIFVSSFGIPKTYLAFGIIFITFLELFYFSNKFNPYVDKALVYPSVPAFDFVSDNKGIDRVWGYGLAGIEPNLTTAYGIYSPDGYDPLYIRRYGEFLGSSRNGKIVKNFDNFNRSDAVIQPGFGKEDFSRNLARLKVLNMLGVKYIYDRVENGSSEITFPAESFRQIYNKDGWIIFENLGVSRRVFLTTDYDVFKSATDFENKFFHRDFNSSNKILLEERIYGIDKQEDSGDVEVVSYTPNSVHLRTDSKYRELLFLSDTYYPGWEAYVDGVRHKIYRANYAFRAVEVPSGKHDVAFVYEPESFYFGLKVSIISVVVLIAVLFITHNYAGIIFRGYRT